MTSWKGKAQAFPRKRTFVKGDFTPKDEVPAINRVCEKKSVNSDLL